MAGFIFSILGGFILAAAAGPVLSYILRRLFGTD